MVLGRSLFKAFKRFYAEGGFSVASAVAFAFVLSVFPFFVFTASIANYFGAEDQVQDMLKLVFSLFPREVSSALVPEVAKAIRNSDLDILTFGGVMMLIFSSNGIESLRAAFDTAYEDEEDRTYVWQRIQGLLFVIETAAVMIIVSSLLVLAPNLTEHLTPYLPPSFVEIFTNELGYAVLLIFVVFQFYLFHRYLPAADHSFTELLPGILLSLVIWVPIAALFSLYLNYASYGAIYAGISQLVVALIFFQITSAIVIFGAYFNKSLKDEREKAAEGRHTRDLFKTA